MTPRDVRVGMRVTVRVAIPASYSGYGSNPVQGLKPGAIATVTSVDVPKVRHTRSNHAAGIDARDTFVNVTFIGDDGAEWRAGVNYCNLREVKV